MDSREVSEKIIELVCDQLKGIRPDQAEALLDSGAIEDLFECRFDRFNRNEHRRSLGLTPLVPPAVPAPPFDIKKVAGPVGSHKRY